MKPLVDLPSLLKRPPTLSLNLMPPSISPSFIIRRLPSSRIAAFRPRTLPRLPLPSLAKALRHQRFSTTTMDNSELTHYLADKPPSVVRLEIEKHFEALTDKQKRYAHFISKYDRSHSHLLLTSSRPKLTVNLTELRLQEQGLSCDSSHLSRSPSMTSLLPSTTPLEATGLLSE